MQKLSLLPKVAIAAFFSATVLLQSCDKVIENAAIDLPAMTATAEVIVPVTNNTSTQQDMGSQVVNYNVDSFIKANTNGTLGINNIKSAKLKSCKIKLNDGSNADNNFQNFESCYASFFTNTKTTPIKMTVNGPTQETYEMSLEVPKDDLAEYFKGTSFTYNVGGKLRKAVTQEVKATVTIEYILTVKKG
jgi:hypothetical protein